jgi:hypothetical protein
MLFRCKIAEMFSAYQAASFVLVVAATDAATRSRGKRLGSRQPE